VTNFDKLSGLKKTLKGAVPVKHKKLLLILIPACLVLALIVNLVFVALRRLPTQTYGEGETQFVVLGDSIAAGANILDKQLAYAWIVAGEKGYTLTNFARSSAESGQLLQRLEEEEEVRRGVREADIIAVSIGGNDMLHADQAIPLVADIVRGDFTWAQPVLDAFRSNFDRIVGELRGLNPDALLIVQTLYNPACAGSPLTGLEETYDALLSGLNDAIRGSLSEQPGAFVIADVDAAFRGQTGLIFIDTFHPSAAGHAVIADVLLDVIGENGR